jgi:hypothetical protein
MTRLNLPKMKVRRRGSTVYSEAVVDTTPQLLTDKMRSFEGACLQIPATVPAHAALTLRALFDCFTKAGTVREGLLGDIVYGFAAAGHTPLATMQGLFALETAGYLRFQAADGAFVHPESDQIGRAWVRYQPKLHALLYVKA